MEGKERKWKGLGDPGTKPPLSPCVSGRKNHIKREERTIIQSLSVNETHQKSW